MFECFAEFYFHTYYEEVDNADVYLSTDLRRKIFAKLYHGE